MNVIKSFFVVLNGWSTKREIRICDDGRAYFEVAEEGHCSVCARRIVNIMEAVKTNNVDIKKAYIFNRYPSDANTLWIGVIVKPEATNEEIVEEMKLKLLLPIYCIL